jgi:3-hydroxyacyl-CoA dehydrogenase / 3-hydroxy-2-methylbutyryl-CoA dehydrogenase
MKITGSVALVTGGASGLGAGVVRMLVREGAHVAIVDLAESNGKDVAAEYGGAARFEAADVADAHAVETAVARIVDEFGRIDVCVTCAGVATAARVVDRSGAMLPLELFRRTVDINLIGTFDVARHAAAHMARNDPNEDGERGVIITTASIAGYEGQIGQAAYAASKGAIIALTLPLARELASLGIRVLCIAPGTMDTAMLGGFDARVRATLMEHTVFPRRAGTPEEFAQLVHAMVTNAYLNGEVVRLDGAARLAPR